ncbi:MAG: hypothetical protein KatS3mg038_2311 [Candidatus Kapaibacterium sp.]|nr:MAG: hypothetical protein KatS3mg038_1476 [Candidatus Kapabacteria bacterium]GIV51790.1 MAG: hypothetical protein KatS3mg038_2311 [Candidatus Kapabacteria bacterium]GIV82977.1 MAG: hypothetical protein KatS3mg051_2331 [Anaerolineae bacterium]
MKVAVIRQFGNNWKFAAGSESSFCVRMNRANHKYWWQLAVQYSPDHWEGVRSAVAVTGQLYDDSAWTPLEPGVELRHGIGCTYWDGQRLVELSGSGTRTVTAWQPGDPTPPGSGLLYWDDLKRLWAQIYLNVAADYEQWRLGSEWRSQLPELVLLLRETEQ